MKSHRFSTTERSSGRRRLPVLALLAALGLGAIGCNMAPKYTRPELPAQPLPGYKENQPGSALAQGNGWKQLAETRAPRDHASPVLRRRVR